MHNHTLSFIIPQSLNYPGEIGYQTFLYSSVKEWRKLLMFLIEKLPKDNTQAGDEPMGAGVMLGRTIAAELALCLSSPWTPAFCKKNSTAWSGSNSWLEVCYIHPPPILETAVANTAMQEGSEGTDHTVITSSSEPFPISSLSRILTLTSRVQMASILLGLQT